MFSASDVQVHAKVSPKAKIGAKMGWGFGAPNRPKLDLGPKTRPLAAQESQNAAQGSKIDSNVKKK